MHLHKADAALIYSKLVSNHTMPGENKIVGWKRKYAFFLCSLDSTSEKPNPWSLLVSQANPQVAKERTDLDWGNIVALQPSEDLKASPSSYFFCVPKQTNQI